MERDGQDSVATVLQSYTADCTQRMMRTDFTSLAQIADMIFRTKHTGAKVYTAGNGGSAATASHICNDLAKGCRVYGRVGFRAECLADSLPVVTCLGNDFSYDDIFSIQVETKGREGDVLLLFSGSGNSENVVRAAAAAKKLGMTVCGFLGRDGGKLLPLCDTAVIAPTDSMEQIEDMHMLYVHTMICALRERLKDSWDAEIKEPCRGRQFKAALFDFDGTFSLIRRGWQDVMVPYFTEVLRPFSPNETPEETETVVRDFVDLLTGKQTIFQCIRLDEEVVRRGGPHVEPLDYKQEFLRRLEGKICHRKAGLADGSIAQDESLVPGSRELVEALRSHGIRCYLASGTDEKDVLREAELLGIENLFDGGIYGAKDDITECSKELVIRSLLQEEGIKGKDLLAFGDGYVEIELVKNIGGYAVGAATEEERRRGVNEWKRNRLLSAGADMIIPDFSDTRRLLSLLKIAH